MTMKILNSQLRVLRTDATDGRDASTLAFSAESA